MVFLTNDRNRVLVAAPWIEHSTSADDPIPRRIAQEQNRKKKRQTIGRWIKPPAVFEFYTETGKTTGSI
jgi:hypothetical protein